MFEGSDVEGGGEAHLKEKEGCLEDMFLDNIY